MIGVFINNHNDAELKVNAFFKEVRHLVLCLNDEIRLYIDPEEKKGAKCSIFFSHESIGDSGFHLDSKIQRLKEQVSQGNVPDRPYVFIRYSSQPLDAPHEHIEYKGREIFKLYVRDFPRWKEFVEANPSHQSLIDICSEHNRKQILLCLSGKMSLSEVDPKVMLTVRNLEEVTRPHQAFINICKALNQKDALMCLLGEKSLTEVDANVKLAVKDLEVMFGSPHDEAVRSLSIIFQAILSDNNSSNEWKKYSWWRRVFSDYKDELRSISLRTSKDSMLSCFIASIGDDSSRSNITRDQVRKVAAELFAHCQFTIVNQIN